MSKASEELEQAIHAFEQNEYGPGEQLVYEAIKAILEERAALRDALEVIVTRMWTKPGGHFHPTDEDKAMGAPSVCPLCVHTKALAALGSDHA